MTLIDIFQFFKNLFLRGIQTAAENFFEVYLLNSFWMLVICLVLVYLTTLVILGTSWYRKSDETRDLVDTDTRVKICGAWAIWVIMLFLVGTVGWIYWKAALPLGSIWLYLRPLSAHWTILILLFLIWLALYLSIRGDSRGAQRTLP